MKRAIALVAVLSVSQVSFASEAPDRTQKLLCSGLADYANQVMRARQLGLSSSRLIRKVENTFAGAIKVSIIKEAYKVRKVTDKKDRVPAATAFKEQNYKKCLVSSF